MNLYRKEISEFVRIAENLLSPASLETPLTQEECRVVDFYVQGWSGLYSSFHRTSNDNAASSRDMTAQ